MAIKKASSYADIDKRNFTFLELKDEKWSNHLGLMERTGSVLIKGDSGHGKTSYTLQLVKAICAVEKVHYSSPEEAHRASFRRALRLNNMKSVQSKFTFAKETYDELFERLSRKRQKKVIIIDSIQVFFAGKKREDYYRLIETFSDTLFIGVSKVNKGKVVGAVADEFYWDCQNRIDISDFKAFLEKSRCGGDEVTPLIISEQKAHERELKLLKRG